MIQQEQLKRAGNDFVAHFGEENGRLYIYFEALQVDPATGQPYRIPYEEVVIKFTHDGDNRSYLKDIYTKVSKNLLTATGKNIKGFEVPETMKSNAKDKADFIAAFAAPVLRFMMNGVIRATKLFGYSNFQPLFAANGARILDSVYNTEQPGYESDPGKGVYDTHNADGTAINGDAAQNIDVTPWRP